MRIKAHGAQKYYDTVEGPARSVIVFICGRNGYQESFDPKPYAPRNIADPSRVMHDIPGVHFSENFKETAKIADKITVCRSMTHGEAALTWNS